jgi:hypothetical protein
VRYPDPLPPRSYHVAKAGVREKTPIAEVADVCVTTGPGDAQ